MVLFQYLFTEFLVFFFVFFWVQNALVCRLLFMLTRYLRLTNYMWMFCEGFYLHRLIAAAFAEQKSFVIFYLLGWGEVLQIGRLTQVQKVNRAKKKKKTKKKGQTKDSTFSWYEEWNDVPFELPRRRPISCFHHGTDENGAIGTRKTTLLRQQTLAERLAFVSAVKKRRRNSLDLWSICSKNEALE